MSGDETHGADVETPVRLQLLNLQYVCDSRGYVAWRWGTGDNVELTHLRATPPRVGNGLSLLRDMLKVLRVDPPYATVFGFTRVTNTDAQAFYQSTGFLLSPVQGVYADDGAVLFSARYEDLCLLHGV